MDNEKRFCGSRGDWSSLPIRKIDEIPIKSFFWGKDCLLCFHCKQRVFSDFDLCRKWIERKGYILHKGWLTIFLKNKGKITLYWCSKDTASKPKATTPGVGRKPGDEEKYCNFFEGE